LLVLAVVTWPADAFTWLAPVEGAAEFPQAAISAAAPTAAGTAHHRYRIPVSPSLVSASYFSPVDT
jgi:hypothetical protein